MIIKWKTRIYYPKIERIECQKETDHCVWVDVLGMGKFHRTNKSSSDDCYHDTWQLAKDHLQRHAENKRRWAREELERCESFLGNVIGLKEPT